MPSNDASQAGGGPAQTKPPAKTRQTLHIRMWRVERLANALAAVIEAGPGQGSTPYTNGEVYLACGMTMAAVNPPEDGERQ